MTNTLIFANNAASTLSGGVTSSSLTFNLSAGGGAAFPNPVSGQYFVATVIDQATGLLREIVWVTARSGDVLTVVRAQEGTTALNWQPNDLIQHLWTAGQAAAMQQQTAAPSSLIYYGADTGTVNNMVASLTPSLSALTTGVIFEITPKYANTSGTVTFAPAGQGPFIVYRADGTSLLPGDIQPAPCKMFIGYDATANKFLLLNPCLWASSPNYIRGIQNNTWTGFIDSGTSDALYIDASPPPGAYIIFEAWLIKKGPNANLTTTPTLNVSGLGAVPLVNMDGSPIPARGLPGGMFFWATYDGANFRVAALNSLRVRLAGNTTLYVNISSGNDGNPGTISAPFQTIQGAINYVLANVDLGGFTLTLNISAGTYGGGVANGAWVGGGSRNVIISGDSSVPSLTNIVTSSGSCINAQGSGAGMTLKNLTMSSTGINGLIAVNETASLQLSTNLTFGACPNSGHMFCAGASSIIINNSYTITGGAQSHWQVITGSIAIQPGVTVTLTGTPAFSYAFASLANCASIFCAGVPTFSGSASSGTIKYSVSANSVLNTGSGNTSLLPGGTAGTLATGGQYL